MPHVTAHAVMSCVYHMAQARRQPGHPYVNMVHQKLLVEMLFAPAKLSLAASHFSTLNMEIANQNMLKAILIAMHNENKADYNENFRICAEESVGPISKGL